MITKDPVSILSTLELQARTTMLIFVHAFWGLNSYPHVCEASPSPPALGFSSHGSILSGASCCFCCILERGARISQEQLRPLSALLRWTGSNTQLQTRIIMPGIDRALIMTTYHQQRLQKGRIMISLISASEPSSRHIISCILEAKLHK